MNQRQHRLLHILIPLILFILGCPAPAPNPDIEPPPPSNGVTILGETSYLAPGSQSNLLVHVQNPVTNRPKANSRVQVMLNPANSEWDVVFEGQTDANGLVQATFDVPATVDDPNQVLTVLAETDSGMAQPQNEVYVGRVYDVLISTDKPVYQPGQTIHLRGLALDSTALKAADAQPLVFTMEDPSGNKLMRQEIVTSQYGIASADFVLDTQAASGDYIIIAELGPVRSTRSVEVKPYTLPRFKIDFQSDNAYYLPGEVAAGTVNAQYFFGKPVAGGQVTIKGCVTDVERFQVFEVTGVTGDDGSYVYEFQVPDYFAGQLENNTAQVDLEITVVDSANHAETIDENVTVAEKAILIEAVPESGFLRPGLENIVYLHASYPDGRDAQAELAIAGSVETTHTVQTDLYGLAVITLTVENNRDVTLDVHARDADGQEATQQLTLGASGSADAVLLRPDKAEYAIGETMNVDIYVAGNAATAYLDIIKGRQTFGLVALPVTDGVAHAALDIDGSLLGALELNAYVITDAGEIVRDRRLALVNPAPADVTVEMDAEVYRPGDTAQIDITVSRDGAPMNGALGVSIVDESVFSVGAQDPGFARTYFLLERELQEPRYEIHGFAPLNADDASPYDKKTDSVRFASCELQSEYCAGIAQDPFDAQQVALAGFFAEELALMEQPEQPALAPENAIAQSKIQNPGASSGPQIGSGWAIRAPLVLPLVGLVFYDGTRRRRRALLALLLISLASFFFVACAAAAPAAPAAGEAAAPAQESAMEAPASETTATRGQASQPPRLRQFFPETLFWLPELETDASGHAQIDVPIADSITTWRVSVLASDQDGNLGSAEVGMRVFQDFFVEPDLPRFLTVGDELDVPVSVFNYLDEAQTVQLTVEDAGWFEFVGEPTSALEIGPNEVAAAYIPIRVTGFGANDFQITAIGSQMSDAVLRQVEVLPDGKPLADVLSGKLSPNQELAVTVPANTVPGASNITVKIYPGIVSQVLDGLEAMLQQPYGCFEQTSSTTYPNVLVLDYLKTTGQINPRIQLQAEQYINLGYQRLLSFEVNGFPGGFSLFGDPPAQTMLTAYGLNEFRDMSQVSYVDPALIERTATFLFQRQQADGSWNPEGMTIESGLENMGEGNLLATAYIAAALADAGYANSEPVQRAISYLESHLDRLLNGPVSGMPGQNAPASPLAAPQVAMSDPYALALIANALVAADVDATTVLDQLIAQAQPGPEDTRYWSSSLSTWLGAGGNVASLETTALAATALLRSGYQTDVAQAAIDYIIGQRDAYGGFYTTQATILSLKALLLAAEQAGEGGDATVTVMLNGDRAQTIEITDETAEVVQQVRFEDVSAGEQSLTIEVEGERALLYQVVAEHYLPWSETTDAQEQQEAMRIEVKYDRSELQVNDVVNVQAEVELLEPGVAGTVLVDLGVPPGFTPVTENLDRLVGQNAIDRYELTGRQILVYLTNVPSGQRITLDYQLLARFPIRAQTPSSQAYDYYTPDKRDTDAPQRIIVKLETPENQ